MKKVVILGGGFGGVGVYQRLHELCHPSRKSGVKIHLINRDNYLTFTPMLHEAATGSVSRENVAQPLRELMLCCQGSFHQAEVQGVDGQKKIVKTDRGEVKYDVLVSALGVAASNGGVPGAEEWGCPMKTLPDAIKVRKQVIMAYEEAAGHSGNKDRWTDRLQPCFLVVGGGATGVELAGQIADLASDEMHRLYPEVQHDKVAIYLVHGGDRILNQMSEKAARLARHHLARLGVVVKEKEAVVEVGRDGVKLASGGTIKTTSIFWATGTESVNRSIFPAEFLDDCGLLLTDKFRQVRGATDSFALGDGAVVEEEQYRTPATAQAAVWEAKLVARNIWLKLQGRAMKARVFHSKGDIVPVGDWFAVLETGRLVWSGKMAWLLRRSVFLVNMYSWGERWRVLSDWLVKIFQLRDTSRF